MAKPFSDDLRERVVRAVEGGRSRHRAAGQIAEAQGNVALARTYYQAALAANPQFGLAQERLSPPIFAR